MANSTAADQITVADVLVGSKADAAAPGAADALQQWAAEDLFPPKQEVSDVFSWRLNVFSARKAA
jgi:G3E family GTPase